jgi:hypothetical protein
MARPVDQVTTPERARPHGAGRTTCAPTGRGAAVVVVELHVADAPGSLDFAWTSAAGARATKAAAVAIVGE